MNHERKTHPLGRRTKYIYSTLLLVIFLTIFTFTLDLNQNSGELCSKCHSMKPQYYTWQASSHNNMNCIDCHLGEGIEGAYTLAKDLTRWTYSEVTKSYILPIRLFRGVDDEVCFSCHNYNREQSIPGKLIIPHEAHTDKRVRCVSCHSAVAHGDIARRAVTRKIDIEKWDEDEGLQQMARSLVSTNKSECMSCHYRRKVTTECASCHGQMDLPDYHDVNGFESNHGAAVRERLEDCNKCHGWTGPKKMVVNEKTHFIGYSRENRFCISCHRAKPDSHADDRFKSTHGNLLTVQGKSKDNCFTCHDNNVVDVPQVTMITCATCHPSKHGTAWRDRHMPPIPPGKALNPTCMLCHSAESCLSCHDLPNYQWPQSNAPVLDDFDTLPEFPLD